jgi:hypothetical protein
LCQIRELIEKKNSKKQQKKKKVKYSWIKCVLPNKCHVIYYSFTTVVEKENHFNSRKQNDYVNSTKKKNVFRHVKEGK